tara:strand:- start:1131 stop:1892 length:762 start_codon:yes stop_codon:yes gene_type:complete
MLEQFAAVNIWMLTLVMTRLGTMLSLVPGFGAAYVLPRYRLSLALVMSFMLLPVVSKYMPSMPDAVPLLILILAGEVVVGAFMASIAIAIVSALQTAGTLIALFSSMANALIQDAVSQQQSSVAAGFLSIMGILLIFVTDLHHLMLRALVESFEMFRPGQPLMFGDMSETVARLVADAFALGLKMSSPLLIVGLAYYVTIGVLGRLMPQLQVFFFGLPVQIMLQIWVFMVALSGMMLAFLEMFQDSYASFLGA